jgi:hypothetical protein
LGSGLAPEEGAEELDGDITHLPGGEAGDFLPGDGIVVQDLLGGGSRRAIRLAPSAWLGWEGRGKGKAEFGIFADASDEGGARGELAQDAAVGVTPVAAHQESAGLRGGLLIQGLTQVEEKGCADLREGVGLFLLAVRLPGFGGRVLFGFGYGRSGLEAHGQGAGGAGRILGSDEEGNLEEAQAAAEVDVKGKGAGVARGGHAGDVASGLFTQGIIEGGQNGGGERSG